MMVTINYNKISYNSYNKIKASQHCQKYSFALTEQTCAILGCLSETQASVSEDSMAHLYTYIAGYLTCKSKNENLDS